jgi:hypothetical protein
MSPWVSTLLALSLLATPADLPSEGGATDGAAFNPAGGPAKAEIADTKDAEKFPLSGSVLAEVSVGAGSFTPGVAARPYVNLLMDFAAYYTYQPLNLVVGLDFGFNVNAVENADSSNVVAHQVKPGDLRLSAKLDGLLAWEALGLKVVPGVSLAFPTSLESKFEGKYVGLGANVVVSYQARDWFLLDAWIAMTKNFNAYTTTVGDHGRTLLSRAGGAEAVAAGRVATGTNITSWSTLWGGSMTFMTLEVLSFVVGFEMLHSFSYAPAAGPSAEAAKEGPGQSDLMYGTLEMSWKALASLSVALGTIVEQAPLSDDNTTLRFPFWDTSNGSENRQVFYLDVTGSF